MYNEAVRRVIYTLLITSTFFGVIWFCYSYLKIGRSTSLEPGKPVFVFETATPSNQTAVPYVIEPFVSNLRVPWSIVFTSPTRILVTERPGRLRVIENGVLKPEPLRTFPEVSNDSEEGLMGMTLDPGYSTNHFVYLCIAYTNADQSKDKVVRYTDTGTALQNDTILLNDIPAAQFHAGCRLRFGPDKKLYISTGDATNKKTAQDTASLGGKILRINPDGSIPSDNPFPNSPVYSYGHRNPQGFDWHPVSNMLVATEHGPSGNDGPGGGDEVNSIKKGSNYGWPVVSHEKSQEGMVDPLLVFTPAVAPASGMFYRGQTFPQFTNTFLFGALKGTGIIQVVFAAEGTEKIVSYQKIEGVDVGRVRDVVEGPDGLIYFTTSNQDGRGKPQPGDDKLYRIVPQQK